MADYKDHIDQASFEQIENYLLGKMDAATQQAFEQQLAGDESLRNEVALQRRLMATVEVGTFLANRQQAASETTTPVRKLLKRWYYAAAAILLIAAGLIYLQRQPAVPGDLYARYFTADPGLPVVMSSDNSEAYTFYDGMVNYKEGRYDVAAGKWELLARQVGYTDTLQYYIGAARLNNGQLKESRSYLQPVAVNDRSVLQEKATWYLALSYIKEKEYTAAVRWLTLLPNDDRAKRLLAEPDLQGARKLK